MPSAKPNTPQRRAASSPLRINFTVTHTPQLLPSICSYTSGTAGVDEGPKPFLLEASAPHSSNLFCRVANYSTHTSSYPHTTLQSIVTSIVRPIAGRFAQPGVNFLCSWKHQGSRIEA
ncbi:hypothetical protein IG631_01798 [Alternaria alternata]|nr:hypothetical protein IG631_01798 [Alternaria alternata]